MYQMKTRIRKKRAQKLKNMLIEMRDRNARECIYLLELLQNLLDIVDGIQPPLQRSAAAITTGCESVAPEGQCSKHADKPIGTFDCCQCFPAAALTLCVVRSWRRLETSPPVPIFRLELGDVDGGPERLGASALYPFRNSSRSSFASKTSCGSEAGFLLIPEPVVNETLPFGPEIVPCKQCDSLLDPIR